MKRKSRALSISFWVGARLQDQGQQHPDLRGSGLTEVLDFMALRAGEDEPEALSRSACRLWVRSGRYDDPGSSSALCHFRTSIAALASTRLRQFFNFMHGARVEFAARMHKYTSRGGWVTDIAPHRPYSELATILCTGALTVAMAPR